MNYRDGRIEECIKQDVKPTWTFVYERSIGII